MNRVSRSSFRCQNLRHSCQGLLRRQELPITHFELGNAILEESHRTRSICFSYNFLSFLVEKTLQSDLFPTPRSHIANRLPSDASRSPRSFSSLLAYLTFFSLSFHYLYQLRYSQEWELIFFFSSYNSQDVIQWIEMTVVSNGTHFQAAIKYR